MTFTFEQVYTATGAIFIYQMKENLKAKGWTVPRSSDGTTYNSSGDQITSGSSGANGLANNNAWFVLQSPSIDGYQKSICFQRSTVNQNWRIKYSFSAGFTGGSPGATQTPSATDEQILLGSNTDASPVFGSWLTTDAAYRGIFILGGAEEYYSFFIVTFPLGGGVINSSFIFECITDESKNSLDGERHLIGVTNNNLFDFNLLSSSASGLRTWYRKNLSGESFLRCPGFFIQSNSTNWHTLLSSSSIGGRFTHLPIIMGRLVSYGGNTGLKGITKHLKLCNVAKNNPISLTNIFKRDYIIFGNCVLPWNGEGIIL